MQSLLFNDSWRLSRKEKETRLICVDNHEPRQASGFSLGELLSLLCGRAGISSAFSQRDCMSVLLFSVMVLLRGFPGVVLDAESTSSILCQDLGCWTRGARSPLLGLGLWPDLRRAGHRPPWSGEPIRMRQWLCRGQIRSFTA